MTNGYRGIYEKKKPSAELIEKKGNKKDKKVPWFYELG
jgi:hypothetical protein